MYMYIYVWFWGPNSILAVQLDPTGSEPGQGLSTAAGSFKPRLCSAGSKYVNATYFGGLMYGKMMPKVCRYMTYFGLLWA